MNVFPLRKLPENESSKFIEHQINTALIEIGGNEVVGYVTIKCLRNEMMEFEVEKGLKDG